MGTSFCRLCGRDYVEDPDAVVEAEVAPVVVEEPAVVGERVAPLPTGAVIPAPALSQDAVRAPVAAGTASSAPVAAAPVAAAPVAAAPVAWPPPPAPVLPPAPLRTGPPAQAEPVAPAAAGASAAPVAPLVAAPAPAPFEMVSVPATGGLHVRLPLAELPDLSAASELDGVAVPRPGKPAPTDTHPVALGGVTLTAPEEEPAEPVRTGRVLDRQAVLVGTLAGFLGGAVSGAAVTLFLS